MENTPLEISILCLSGKNNTRESLGELEKAVETLGCGLCSHSISRSPKLPLVFVLLDRNTVHVFYFLKIRSVVYNRKIFGSPSKEGPKGPGFWKLNTSPLARSDYVEMINKEYPNWLTDGTDLSDKRVKWDWLKFKIKTTSIAYSKNYQEIKKVKRKNLT